MGKFLFETNLQSFVVKLATPLLLLGANLFKILKETKGLLKSFLLGTLGNFFYYTILNINI